MVPEADLRWPDYEATSCQVVCDDDHVIHNIQLAAASSGTTSLSSMTTATWAALSDSGPR